MNCKTCPSYNNGKGSRACEECDKFKDILPRSKPSARSQRLRSEILEETTANIPTAAQDLIRTIDTTLATMALQILILGMTQKEMAEYYKVSLPTIKRRCKKITTIFQDLPHTKARALTK
ncbi:MAG: hypothetical protein V3U75_01225 [Methylococcaceae bacterium]